MFNIIKAEIINSYRFVLLLCAGFIVFHFLIVFYFEHNLIPQLDLFEYFLSATITFFPVCLTLFHQRFNHDHPQTTLLCLPVSRIAVALSRHAFLLIWQFVILFLFFFFELIYYSGPQNIPYIKFISLINRSIFLIDLIFIGWIIEDILSTTKVQIFTFFILILYSVLFLPSNVYNDLFSGLIIFPSMTILVIILETWFFCRRKIYVS